LERRWHLQDSLDASPVPSASVDDVEGFDDRRVAAANEYDLFVFGRVPVELPGGVMPVVPVVRAIDPVGLIARGPVFVYERFSDAREPGCHYDDVKPLCRVSIEKDLGSLVAEWLLGVWRVDIVDCFLLNNQSVRLEMVQLFEPMVDDVLSFARFPAEDRQRRKAIARPRRRPVVHVRMNEPTGLSKSPKWFRLFVDGDRRGWCQRHHCCGEGESANVAADHSDGDGFAAFVEHGQRVCEPQCT